MKKLLILSAIASVLLVSCGQKDTTNTTISTQTGAYPNAYASLPKFDEIIKKVTKAINGGDNGLAERINFTNWTKEHLKYDSKCINK